MLSELQFRKYLTSLRIPKAGKVYIELVRTSEPARRVQSRIGNVTGWYPSRKMGRTIQFESHRNELAFITKTEYDPEIIEYWDQPPSIVLHYKTTANKNIGVIHTPDFFLLKRDGAGWIECKPQKDLEKLSEKNPNRFYFDGTIWRCPPGEELANKYGFFYQVRSSSEINWIYLRNVAFLEDYLKTNYFQVSAEQEELILSWVCSKLGISLFELLELSRNESIPLDAVYQLIAFQILFSDLDNQLLTEPERTLIFSSYDAFQHYNSSYIPIPFIDSTINWELGSSMFWDGKLVKVVNRGKTQTWLESDNGKIFSVENDVLITLFEKKQIQLLNADEQKDLSKSAEAFELIRKSPPAALREANRRYNLLKSYWQTKKLPENISERTMLRWQENFRTAEIIHENGYLGLLPNTRNQGNRLSKLPPKTLEVAYEFIDKYFGNFKQSNKKSVWVRLHLYCEENNLISPAYKTFCRMIKERPTHKQNESRKGKIAAYDTEELYLELDQYTPRHGERPFQIVHIDHTELDIELVCSKTGKNLGRAWLTIMIDAFSRRILANYLSFDPPSYRSCMMAIRDLIKRYRRFPQTIVVDGGLEFSSVYFETLLAHYGCTLKVRPGKKPRFGSVCERIFGTTNTQFIYNLIGNTQITRENVRFIYKENDPRNLAVWTLESLYIKLCEYCFEVYDKLEHSTLGVSPRELFIHAQNKFGERSHKFIAYDENFILMTLPTTNKGTAKVYPGRGVLINNIHYVSQHFRNPKIENSRVPVRFDPYNIGVAYAYIRGYWHQCFSEEYASFKNQSEKLIQIASAQLRKRKKQGTKRLTLNSRLLAKFLLEIENTENELLHLQKLRDFAQRKVFRIFDDSSSTPETNADVEPTVSHKTEAPDRSEAKNSDHSGRDEFTTVDLTTLQVFGEY